jgi:hypothetical protein
MAAALQEMKPLNKASSTTNLSMSETTFLLAGNQRKEWNIRHDNKYRPRGHL